MLDILIESYHKGGLQLVVIFGLAFACVHLWRDCKRLYRDRIKAEKRHAKEITLISLRMKQLKNEPVDYDEEDRPTGEYHLGELLKKQLDALKDFQGDADEIEEALKELDQ